MSNFGFTSMRVVNPYEVAYAEARSAVNASHVLLQSQQYPTVAEAVADCTLVVGTTAADGRMLSHTLRRLESAATALIEASHAGDLALLFGCEKSGLANQDLQHCHWLTRIPSRPEHGSMNLGQAVAVVLYELIRREDQEHRAPAPPKEINSADRERIVSMMIEALTLSGYIQGTTARSGEQKIRRMFHRLNVREIDGPVWLGMWRQLLWKLKSGDTLK